METEVFISYSRGDGTFVERLDGLLKGAGVSTWFDRVNLRPGMKWADVIEDEIPAARVFLTCLSATGATLPITPASNRKSLGDADDRLMSRERLTAPLSGEDFFVTEEILRAYAKSAEAFFGEIAAALDDRQRKK